MSKDNSERMDRFFRNKMSEEEESIFLQDLNNDKELLEEAQLTALMIEGLKEWHANEETEIIEEVLASKKKRAKIIRLVRWSMSIAAMFILIVGATIWWNSRLDTESLFNKYYTPYSVQTMRGGDADVEKELANLFNQVGTSEDMTPVIEELQKIYNSINSEYEYRQHSDDIAWYLALAYLKGEKPEKAKELLKSLAEKNYEKANRSAKKLYTELNE